MNNIKELPDKIKTAAVEGANVIAKHRFVIMVVIVGAAIAFSLVRTRSFLDIPRNEARYTEEVSLINYKEIDQEILEEFKAAELDGNVEVNSNLAPDRSNPFNE